MAFIMPCEPGSPRRIDPAWAIERDMLKTMGHTVVLADHDLLERGDRSAFAHSNFQFCEGSLAWRGWMLSGEGYELAEELLRERDMQFLDDTEAYLDCHYGPRLLDVLAPWQSYSALLPLDRLDDLDGFLMGLPQKPMIIKDWVKSEAGLWHEACFIPNPHDLPNARKVVGRFLELRGQDVTGGVVFREWQPLLQDAQGRAAEWRCFVVDGHSVLGFPRMGGPVVEPPMSVLSEAIHQINTRWATLDWARDVSGQPLLLEVGYGGVSGIPDGIDPSAMFEAVDDAMKKTLSSSSSSLFRP